MALLRLLLFTLLYNAVFAREKRYGYGCPDKRYGYGFPDKRYGYGCLDQRYGYGCPCCQIRPSRSSSSYGSWEQLPQLWNINSHLDSSISSSDSSSSGSDTRSSSSSSRRSSRSSSHNSRSRTRHSRSQSSSHQSTECISSSQSQRVRITNNINFKRDSSSRS